MKKYNAEELVHNYVRNTATEDERIIIESWHIQDLKDSTFIPSVKNIENVQERMWNKLTSTIHRDDYVIRKKIWPRVTIVAALLIITSAVIHITTQPISKQSNLRLAQNDIAPADHKAILTLDNGEKIILNKNSKKLITIQGDNDILKSDGVLIYDQQNKIQKNHATNKLETPKGGTYRLILSDGTKVWLNSGSILTYPTSFTGKERIVNLEGEAYFEVSKNKEKVFKVICKTQMIQVLGTQFNIKSYSDENVAQTTLAEGKVKITKGDMYKILKPRQTAINETNSKYFKIDNANLEKDLAWKNNEFIFDGDDLISIMREISRWYDVEFIYHGNINQNKYSGVISRSKNLSEVLKMLQLTGKINFKIEGRRIILMN